MLTCLRLSGTSCFLKNSPKKLQLEGQRLFWRSVWQRQPMKEGEGRRRGRGGSYKLPVILVLKIQTHHHVKWKCLLSNQRHDIHDMLVMNSPYDLNLQLLHCYIFPRWEGIRGTRAQNPPSSPSRFASAKPPLNSSRFASVKSLVNSCTWPKQRFE